MENKIRTAGQGAPSFIEQARRRQIVDCAIEVIAELGYAQASLAEIARRAAVSKGVISYHFASKDALIRSVIDDIFSEGAAVMGPKVAAESTARGMLRAYIESDIGFIRTHRHHMVAIVEIFMAHRSSGTQLPVVHETLEEGLRALEQILSWGQERGEFRQFDVTAMATTIRAAIDAVPPRYARDPTLDVEAYGRELVTIFQLATRA